MNIPYLENYIAKCKKNAQDCEEIRKQEYELAISRYTLNTIKLIRIIDVIYQYSTIQKKKKKEDIRNSSKLTIYFDAISGYCLNNNPTNMSDNQHVGKKELCAAISKLLLELKFLLHHLMVYIIIHINVLNKQNVKDIANILETKSFDIYDIYEVYQECLSAIQDLVKGTPIDYLNKITDDLICTYRDCKIEIYNLNVNNKTRRKIMIIYRAVILLHVVVLRDIYTLHIARASTNKPFYYSESGVVNRFQIFQKIVIGLFTTILHDNKLRMRRSPKVIARNTKYKYRIDQMLEFPYIELKERLSLLTSSRGYAYHTEIDDINMLYRKIKVLSSNIGKLEKKGTISKISLCKHRLVTKNKVPKGTNYYRARGKYKYRLKYDAIYLGFNKLNEIMQ